MLNGEPRPDIIGQLLMPTLNAFEPPRPKLSAQLLLPQPVLLLLMALDMTFIMVSIMRNIRPAMSSPAACTPTGPARAQTRTSVARVFFMK